VRFHVHAIPYLVRAFARKLGRLLIGAPLWVEPKEEERRLAICAQCVHRRHIEGQLDQCDICDCFLVLKARFVDECCPLRPKPRW
jgi:hypothetical protein